MEAHRRYFYNNLKYHRVLMNYRKKDVAALLKLEARQQIGIWERGLALPSMINLLKLSAIYRTFPHELYPDLMQEIIVELVVQEQQLSDSLPKQ